jgi:hypothetical protein
MLRDNAQSPGLRALRAPASSAGNARSGLRSAGDEAERLLSPHRTSASPRKLRLAIELWTSGPPATRPLASGQASGFGGLPDFPACAIRPPDRGRSRGVGQPEFVSGPRDLAGPSVPVAFAVHDGRLTLRSARACRSSQRLAGQAVHRRDPGACLAAAVRGADRRALPPGGRIEPERCARPAAFRV